MFRSIPLVLQLENVLKPFSGSNHRGFVNHSAPRRHSLTQYPPSKMLESAGRVMAPFP